MWSIGILCLLLSLVVQLSTIQTQALEENSVNLKISVRRDVLEDVASCVQALSQVTIENLDLTEPVVVHSVWTTTENVFRAEEETNENVANPPAFDVPQQFHTAEVKDVKVGPRQIAAVPLTFLPRFPPITAEVASPEPMSAISLDYPRYYRARRSTIGYTTQEDQFAVHTNVMLNTSRGLLKMPIVSSSLRENGYSLPEVIQFRNTANFPLREIHPGVVVMDSDDWGDDTGWGDYGNEKADCVDIYLSNPSYAKSFKILDVFVSRPDLVTMLYNNEEITESQLNQMFQMWDDLGQQRVIGAGVTSQYLVTLCNVPSTMPLNSNARKGTVPLSSDLNNGLGYFQVRTDSNTLVVNLEQVETEYHVALEKPMSVDVEPGEDPRASYYDSSFPELGLPFTVINPRPTKVHMQLTPNLVQAHVHNIEFENTSPHPVLMAQLSLVTPFVNDTELHDKAVKAGLIMEARVERREMTDSSDVSILEEFIILTSSISPKPALMDDLRSGRPYYFTGSVIVRTVFDNSLRDQACEEADTYQNVNMTIEVPYEVVVIDPSMHVVLDNSSQVSSWWKQERRLNPNVTVLNSLFFPLRRFEGRIVKQANTTDERRFDEPVTVKLHVASYLDRPLTASQISVVDPVVDGRDKWRANFCKRFTLDSFFALDAGSRLENTSLFDLATVSLTYHMEKVSEPKSKRNRYEGKSGVLLDDGLVVPHTCILTISPNDAQKLEIPLVIAPGKVDVTPSRSTIGGEKPLGMKLDGLSGRETFSPSLNVGIEEIVQCLRSSGMGTGLKKTLTAIFSDHQKTVDINDGTAMLTRYLANLHHRGQSKGAGTSLWPILINAGAVVHREVHSSTVYISNHNPFPVKVTIDVGEVEGMSIALARDFSHAKGGGNRLFNKLPEIDDNDDLRIKTGPWKGHSRRGLHQFFLNSGLAQVFTSALQYRDDVSQSPIAVKLQPLLKSLYKEKDLMHYHSGPVPPHLLSSKSSTCEGIDLHPSDYAGNVPNRSKTDSFRPLIMTDTLSISRHLNSCHDIKATLEGDSIVPGSDGNPHSPTLIPPGGVARFEVKVRCPARHSLDSDITRFLTTGLVLSTDHGQVIPVVATFEALLGHLQIAHTGNDASEEPGELAFDIPARLFQSPVTSDDLSDRPGILIRPQNSRNATTVTMHAPIKVNRTETEGVPIYVWSSFARDVIVKEVESCNPWFELSLGGLDTDSELSTLGEGRGAPLGTVRSAIPCQSRGDEFDLEFPQIYPQFSSFYDCALDWLQRRLDLQPRGCGLAPRPVSGWSDPENTENDIHAMAVEVLTQASHYSLITFNDGIPRGSSHSSTRSENTTVSHLAQVTPADQSQAPSHEKNKVSSPFIPNVAVDLFAQVQEAWRLVAGSGLNSVSSNLRAKINYGLPDTSGFLRKNTADNNDLQTLSVAMQDVAVRTSLEIPSLVDHTRLQSPESAPSEPGKPAVLEFPAAAVAEVTAMMVPLRNPTSVPVRVRLTALGKSAEGDNDVFTQIGFNSVRSDVRDRYLKHSGNVYVQNSNLWDRTIEGDAWLWWDGGGTYFMPDDRGDLIQAKYNLSYAAGQGSHISLISPALHAFNGLLMFCGTRCGVTDEQSQNNAKIDQPRTRDFSPIGASSAAGTALLGQPRPAKSASDFNEQYIAAGGSMPAINPIPAFAIPYESLGEIVLPPYGTGELGPILFRPPGRFSIHGCESTIESQSIPPEEKTAKACDSTVFESLVLIENSLTGLERLIVQGKALWERIVFLDPEPSDSTSEAFGDMEYRHGRPTLVFLGTSVSDERNRTKPAPVKKEVVVQNDGDTLVEFEQVYFSQGADHHFRSRADGLRARRSREKKFRVQSEPRCQIHGFHLLDCDESEGSELERNLYRGFTLSPGQKLSLFIEHYPDCSSSTEFVTLNFVHDSKRSNRTTWTPGQSRSRQRIGSGKRGGLERREVQLMVGFDMQAGEMSSCVPVSPALRISVEDHCEMCLSGLTGNRTSICHRRPRKSRFVKWSTFFAARIVLLWSAAYAVSCVVDDHNFRLRALQFFRSHHRGGGIKASGQMPEELSLDNDWSAAFRCLARADPLSSDLQALGREQAKQLVLNRYKSIGAISPQCISPAGVFSRDRSGVVVGGTRRASGGGVLAGAEKRALTVSDAIFKEAFTDPMSTSAGSGLAPCSLDWRAATAKGMLKKSYLSDFPLKSRELLLERRKIRMEEADRESESVDYNNSCHSDESVNMKAEEARDDYERVEHEVNPAEEDDEQKGDAVSTSESEGTTGALKEVELTPESEPDLTGFEKVSGKGKASSRLKTKKKASHDDAVLVTKQTDRAKATTRRNDTQPDASRLPGTKQQVDPRTSKQATSLKPSLEREGRPQESKAALNIMTDVRSTAQQTINKAVEQSEAQNRKAKNRQPNGSSKALQKASSVSSPIVGRGTSASSSVNSSPASISSRSTTRSEDRMHLRDLPDRSKRSGLRPPPGLAPPPGFSDGNELLKPVSYNEGLPPLVPSLTQTDATLPEFNNSAEFPPLPGSALPLLSPETSSVTAPSSSLFNAVFVEETAPIELSKGRKQPIVRRMSDRDDPQASSSGFDVMDFLDSILEDTRASEEEGIGDLLEDTSSATHIRTVSSNPWASESNSSSFGILVAGSDDNNNDDFDKTDDIVYAILSNSSTNLTSGENRSSVLHNAVPLLTPDAMLSAIYDNDDEDRVPLFNRGAHRRGSFYSSLLNED